MSRSVWRLAALAVLGAAYLWLGHLGSVSENPPAICLLTGLLPLWAIALALAWHTRPRGLWLALLGLATGGVFLKLDLLRQNTAWVFFLQHAGTHALLGISFARTLFAGHDQALCSRIAGITHGPLSPRMARYTWQVTLAWTIYFFAAMLCSLGLFALAPLEAWSVFANLLTAPLIGAIFVIEYLIRLRSFPNERHIGVLGTIKAYRDYSRGETRSNG